MVEETMASRAARDLRVRSREKSSREVRRKTTDYGPLFILSIATKIVPAGPVRGILQGGHQVFSTILMYTEKRGRGTILVAIESSSIQTTVGIGYRPRWRSDIWRTDRGVAEVRSPDIRPATEDDIRHNAPELVEENHLKTLVFRF